VPNIKYNLIAVNWLDKHYKLVFTNGKCYILDKYSQTIAEAQSKNNLYQLCLQASISLKITLMTAKATKPTALPIYHWYEHLSHLHKEAIKKLKSLADGMEIAPDNPDVLMCWPCLQGKQHQTFNHTLSTRATQHLELVHSDLCGPFPTPSIAGSKYFILYIDDYSRMAWIYFLRSKTAIEVTKVFQTFKTITENTTGLKIRRFCCDNGRGEYDNRLLKDLLFTSIITVEPSPPYTQNQNSMSEWRIRTTVERTWSMLYNSGLSESFWAKACNIANYLVNCSPMKALDNMTPYEA